jgi:xanthine dehydrogenase molybdopterin binding subunit/xanthine dehydrogenase small subunit
MSTAFQFTLNGERRHVEGLAPTTTLLDYLRQSGVTGSKEGCAEGDCGACSVAIVEMNARGDRTYRAINSCITLLPMVAGREVITVEGIGGDGPHAIQDAMVQCYGSQCGYCTPGFVVSMFEGYYRDDAGPQTELTEQLAGNLCRCTGYRPIRDAMVDALRRRDKAPIDPFQRRLSDPEPPRLPLDYEHDGARFLRPTTFAELLQLRAVHPDAVLVGGATELGVELNKKQRRLPLLIATDAVVELTAITKTATTLRVGGAATLTALGEAIGGEFAAIRKMLRVFASRQIRNRATLAGNLVTASPIGDMAPVLLALDADVELTSVRGRRTLPLSEFFLGYRKTALHADEILEAVVIARDEPHASRRRLIDAYKVSKRRELDISIVAAAFAIELDEANVIQRARLAYGGVAATPARARHTEELLVGKSWNTETLARATERLRAEFTPLDDVRAGAAYRRELVASLFEKFFAGEDAEPPEKRSDAPRCVDAEPLDLSRSQPHESARGHVTGGALYVDDEARRRPMLTIWPVMTSCAHGRILRRDGARARSMLGVRAVLFAEDIPGRNDVGALAPGETLLAIDEISFHGQLVAIVVGESTDACRRAAEAVEVDVQPMPPLLGIRAAIAAASFHTSPHIIRRGDCEAALSASPRQVEGELELGGQEHLYLESQSAWAEPGDDGDVRVTSSSQHPSEIQAAIAHVLDLPRNKVVVVAPRMGGGFGGKETQGNTWAALVALAAVVTGEPVRLQLDRDVDMVLTGKRHPFLARYRVGFDEQGQILAAEVNLWSDGGWALDLSESICDRALFHLDNAYYIPNASFSGRVARTNTVSNTAFRGFGGPQGMLVIEDAIDRIARELNILPEIVRERNLYRGDGATNTTPYGQELDDERIQAIWAALRSSAALDRRRASIARFNATSPFVKRGIAMTPVKFGIAFTASFLNQAGALVLIYRDGSVQVNHGGTEMGQGLNTKIRGIAMRELGLPLANIRVMKTSTDKVPNTSPTAASSGSDLNGAAVQDACATLRARLAEVAADELELQLGVRPDPRDLRFEDGAVVSPASPEARLSFADLVERAYLRQVSLAATGYYRTPGLAYDRAKGKGRPFHYFAYGAAVAEVEVDGHTGMKHVRRVDILHDVGDTLNPGIDRGQIEGGFVQGMGWLTGEELRWDAQGKLLTHSASTYAIPSFGDAPVDFRVTMLAGARQDNVIHGSKAVGEPPLMLALSVREALRDAIAAFGPPGGAVPLASPATHEAIFHAIFARARGPEPSRNDGRP